MMQFFQTLMGKKFFENQLPSLIEQLSKIAVELKRQNDLKEKELEK